MTEEWQYSNPFYQDGVLAASSGKTLADCPYDYIRFDEEADIKMEMYRQQEWYAGFRSISPKNED